MHLFSLPLCGKSSVFYRAISRVHKWIARTFTPSNIKQVKVCVLSLVSLFKQSNQPRNDVWSTETSLQWVTSCWHFLHCQVWQRRLRPWMGLKGLQETWIQPPHPPVFPSVWRTLSLLNSVFLSVSHFPLYVLHPCFISKYVTVEYYSVTLTV